MIFYHIRLQHRFYFDLAYSWILCQLTYQTTLSIYSCREVECISICFYSRMKLRLLMLTLISVFCISSSISILRLGLFLIFLYSFCPSLLARSICQLVIYVLSLDQLINWEFHEPEYQLVFSLGKWNACNIVSQEQNEPSLLNFRLKRIFCKQLSLEPFSLWRNIIFLFTQIYFTSFRLSINLIEVAESFRTLFCSLKF